MYPSTGVSAPWPRCRAQLEMQVRRCTRRQARQVRQAHTQRSRTHTSTTGTGVLPGQGCYSRLDSSFSDCRPLLRPSSRSNPHWLVPRLPPGSSAAAPSRFRPPTAVSALVHSTSPSSHLLSLTAWPVFAVSTILRGYPLPDQDTWYTPPPAKVAPTSTPPCLTTSSTFTLKPHTSNASNASQPLV